MYDGVIEKPELNEETLAHHGIKGQKWGIRRYQNPDGSLKTAGKKRKWVNGVAVKKEKKLDTLNKKLEKSGSKYTASYKGGTLVLTPKNAASNSKSKYSDISTKTLKVMAENLGDDVHNNHNKNKNSQIFRQQQAKTLREMTEELASRKVKENQESLKKNDILEKSKHHQSDLGKVPSLKEDLKKKPRI